VHHLHPRHQHYTTSIVRCRRFEQRGDVSKCLFASVLTCFTRISRIIATLGLRTVQFEIRLSKDRHSALRGSSSTFWSTTSLQPYIVNAHKLTILLLGYFALI
jgi:hypothetical protein